jgi:hypothetical protein
MVTTAQAAPPSALIATLARGITGLGVAAEVGVTLVDGCGTHRVVAVSDGRAAALMRIELEHAEGPASDCRTTGRPVSVPDLSRAHDRWPTFAPAANTLGFRSAQAIPLRLRGTVLGTIELLLALPGGVALGQLRAVCGLADMTVVALEQERELARARDVAAELEHALHSRIVIEQAKGILAEQAGVSVDVAFELLRRSSRDSNRRLVTIAGEVVDSTLRASDLTPSHAAT